MSSAKCCSVNLGLSVLTPTSALSDKHGDVIKWKHFPLYWPFVRGIHPSPINSRHKGQWRGALMFSLIFAWINGWVNNREAGDLRRHRTHYDRSEYWRLCIVCASYIFYIRRFAREICAFSSIVLVFHLYNVTILFLNNYNKTQFLYCSQNYFMFQWLKISITSNK